MSNNNKLRNLYESRVAHISVLAGLGLFALTGCGPDTKGVHDGFKLTGKVTSGGDRSLSLSGIQVEESEGDAVGYLDGHDKRRFHNNFQKCEGFFKDLKMHTVGHAFDTSGNPELFKDVHAGEVVELSGRVQDSYTFCGKSDRWEERAVFTQLHEIAQ